jgi:hypothetical protein
MEGSSARLTVRLPEPPRRVRWRSGRYRRSLRLGRWMCGTLGALLAVIAGGCTFTWLALGQDVEAKVEGIWQARVSTGRSGSRLAYLAECTYDWKGARHRATVEVPKNRQNGIWDQTRRKLGEKRAPPMVPVPSEEYTPGGPVMRRAPSAPAPFVPDHEVAGVTLRVVAIAGSRGSWTEYGRIENRGRNWFHFGWCRQ